LFFCGGGGEGLIPKPFPVVETQDPKKKKTPQQKRPLVHSLTIREKGSTLGIPRAKGEGRAPPKLP